MKFVPLKKTILATQKHSLQKGKGRSQVIPLKIYIKRKQKECNTVESAPVVDAGAGGRWGSSYQV